MRRTLPLLLVVLLAFGASAWGSSAGMYEEVLLALRELSRADTRDAGENIPSGAVTGHSAINKFGANSDVDTAEDVWSGGGDYVVPTAARVHAVASTSAADTSAGTGARTLRIYGLDEDFLAVSEDVTLSGVTPVNTTLSYVRVYRMKLLTAGSGGVNAGLITATAATDATVSARIEIGDGQTLMAHYSVQAGSTAYLTGFYATANKDKANEYAIFEIRNRVGIDTATPAVRVKHRAGVAASQGAPLQHNFYPYPAYQGPCDIWLRVVEVSAIDFSVSGGFDLILVED